MSTQKAKFALFSRLQELGFTYEESAQLRRIEMTLHRWAEQECGDSNDFSSWSIERDETTGKPFRCVYPHNRKMHRYPIADREAGALKRLAQILKTRNNRVLIGLTPSTQMLNTVSSYYQGDCRGCMLYLFTNSQMIQDGKILPVDQYYNRGLAICA